MPFLLIATDNAAFTEFTRSRMKTLEQMMDEVCLHLLYQSQKFLIPIEQVRQARANDALAAFDAMSGSVRS
jgi:hypothetical protein